MQRLSFGEVCAYTPRFLVEKIGGWNDYNVAEDDDFLARAFRAEAVKFFPISMEINEPYEEWRKGSLTALRFAVIAREKRYSQGFGLTKRLVRNIVDEQCGLGFTTRKLVIRHEYLRIKVHKTFMAVILMLFSKFLNSFCKRPITYVDKDLNNANYNYYNLIKNLVDPRKFGFTLESDPLSLDDNMDFAAALKPDIKESLKLYYSTRV